MIKIRRWKLTSCLEIALDLIEFLCKNSVSLKQSNGVLNNSIRINKN